MLTWNIVPLDDSNSSSGGGWRSRISSMGLSDVILGSGSGHFRLLRIYRLEGDYNWRLNFIYFFFGGGRLHFTQCLMVQTVSLVCL